MLYKQLEAVQGIDLVYVEKFDFWLATLPKENQKMISASLVADRIGIEHSVADQLLRFCKEHGILQTYFVAECKACGHWEAIEKEVIATMLTRTLKCKRCKATISPQMIYVAYRVVKQPDATEEEIQGKIESRLASHNI